MTPTVGARLDRQRAAGVAIVIQVATWAVFFILLIATTCGCRCGSVERHRSEVALPVPSGGADSSVENPLASVPSMSQPSVSVEEDRTARLDAIKADILSKLGIESEAELPSSPNNENLVPLNGTTASSVSFEERRQVISLYEQSVEQLKGKVHRVNDGRLPRAKQFYSFKPVSGNDTLSTKIRSSVSTRHMYIRFRLDLQSAATEAGNGSALKANDSGREFYATSALLKLHHHRHPRRHLFSAVSPSRSRLRLRVNVYQVLSEAADSSPSVADDGDRAQNRRRIRKRLVDSRLVVVMRSARRHGRPAVEEFDVLKSVSDWLDDPSTNLGLLVTAELEPLSAGNASASVAIAAPTAVRVADLFETDGDITESNSDDAAVNARRLTGGASSSSVPSSASASSTPSSMTMPTLNILGRHRQTPNRRGRPSLSRSGQRRRQRRRRTRRSATSDGGDCHPGDGETRCCRHRLWVSFREIGWDRWILKPEGYWAYYCDGSCPPLHRVAHKHASIQALVNGARPEAAPAPCCAPTRMSPLPIVHLNADGRHVVSVFENMIVDECMCT